MNTAISNPTPPPGPVPEAKPLYTKISNLQDVLAMHREPLGVRVQCYGRLLEFTGRRLSPEENNSVRTLLKSAIPPRDEKGEYDFNDEAFKLTAEVKRAQARAKVLWLAFGDYFRPLAAERQADTGDLDRLVRFLESLDLKDELLDALYDAAVNEPVELVELVGFFSAGSSPKS